MRFLKCLFILPLLCIYLPIFSQEQPSVQNYDDWKKVIPQEPNVASLFKFNDVPVNEYTGVPNISIPICALQEDEVQIPISLSYHSGGIRVGEESSNVGLGWALLAGGAITRSLDDRDDLRIHRAVLPDPPLDQNGHFLPRTSRFDVISEDNSGIFKVNEVDTQLPDPESGFWSLLDRWDYIPDIFRFNFNGYSGSFVFTKDMEVFLLEDSDLKINYIAGNSWDDGIFTITTPEGTLYEFAQTVVVTPLSGTGVYSYSYVSTWYLTKISTRSRAKEILFSYDTREDIVGIPTFTQNLFLVPHSTNETDDNNSRTTSSSYLTDGVYLEQITSPKATVTFDYSGQRSDITTGYILKNITVDQTIGTQNTVKVFELNHSYFGNPTDNNGNWKMANNDYAGYIPIENHTSHYSLRLRLDSIVENSIKTHQFEYYDTTSAPRKTSLSQDHWGYYNGAYNDESFIPLYPWDAERYSSDYVDLPNSDREPNIEDAKLFTLKKITYPTGGYTEFDHELHTFDNADTSSVLNLEQSNVVVVASTFNDTDGIVQEESFEIIGPSVLIDFDFSFNFTNWPGKFTPPPNNTDPPIYGQVIAYVNIEKADGTLIYEKDYFHEDLYFPHQNAPAQAKFNEHINLSSGEHTIKVYFEGNNDEIEGSTNTLIRYSDEVASSDAHYLEGGGLRVASITNYDTDASFIGKKVYDYHYQDYHGKTKSHGVIRNIPNYAPYGSEYAYFDSKYTVGIDPIYGFYPYVTHVTVTVNNDVILHRTIPRRLYRTSNTSLYQDQGSYVGYDEVTIATVNESGSFNGKEVYKFEPFHRFPQPQTGPAASQFTGVPNLSPYVRNFPRIADPETGLLRVKETYSKQGNEFKLVQKQENDYQINGIAIDNYNYQNFQHNSNYVLGGVPFADFVCLSGNFQPGDCEDSWYWYHLHPFYKNTVLKTSSRLTNYDLYGNETVAQDSYYYYESPHHLQPSRIETIASNGEVITTSFYYPDDIGGLDELNGYPFTNDQYATINNLKSDSELCRIGQLVQQEVNYKNNITIRRNIYDDFGNYKILKSKDILMKKSATSQDYFSQETVNYNRYDDDGNLLEVSRKNGPKTALFWGYNHQLPILQAENATYDNLENAVSWAMVHMVGKPTGVISLEDLLAYMGLLETNTKRVLWDNFNSKLREYPNLSKSLITSYSHNPLVGITSITNPNGYIQYFEYDDQNRLKYLKDVNSNIYRKYEYHYNNQD